MNTESNTTRLDSLVSTLERVLMKFDEIETKMTTLHEELDYVMEEIVVSKAEIRQSCDVIKDLENTQVQGEELHEKVSNTFENLFSQMSQIVHAAREGLLERGGPQDTPVTSMTSETETSSESEPVCELTETSAPTESGLEQLKMETNEPVIEESRPEPELSTEDDLPSMEEVHQTLKEVAKTLVETENPLEISNAVPTEPQVVADNIAAIAETAATSEEGESEMEEEPQGASPLAELNNLLADTKKEVMQELVGDNPESNTETELQHDADIPMASEPPELLKETLAKAGSFGNTEDGIETEDLGQDTEGEPSAEMSELLKSISSSYVAGSQDE